jgi:ABC-2 type transport system permease protein
MMADIFTIWWKEWKGLFRWSGSGLKAVLTLLAPIGVFGVFVPWDSADHWVNGVPSIFAAVAVPFIVVMLTVPDLFAGERERHTLATLLASRLPDRVILLGKASFSMMLAVGMALATLILALITFNLAHWSGAVVLYSPKLLVVDPMLSVLMAGLATGSGILISLRAGTVQEAQQTLVAVTMLPPMVLGPLVLLISRARPEWGLRTVMGGLGEPGNLALLFAALLVVVVLLFAWAQRRFQRARLL